MTGYHEPDTSSELIGGLAALDLDEDVVVAGLGNKPATVIPGKKSRFSGILPKKSAGDNERISAAIRKRERKGSRRLYYRSVDETRKEILIRKMK